MDYSMVFISIKNLSFDIKESLVVDKFSWDYILLLSKNIKIMNFCFRVKVCEIRKDLIVDFYFKSSLEFFLILGIFNNILNRLIFKFFLNISKILLINFWQLDLNIWWMNCSLEEHLRELNKPHKIVLLNTSS